jgi:hypothetical protein
MTLRVTNVEYDLYQGSYSELDLVYPNYVNGVLTPINLTGASITCKVKKNTSSPTVLTLSTASSTIVITDAPSDKFKLKFPSALTSAMTEKGNVVYQGHVEVVLAGETTRPHQLTITFYPEINV